MDERNRPPGVSGPNKPQHGAPFSLRLSPEERKALDSLADGQPLGSYIKDALFNREVRPRTRGTRPVRDREALARLLGLLGQSRISQNINQLAKAANTGSLPVNADVHQALLDSCAAIHAMRTLLLCALGLQPEAGRDKGDAPEDPKGGGR